MNFTFRILTLSACLTAVLAAASYAQNRTPSQPPRSASYVAVLDVKLVFDHHPGFKGKVDAIKREIEAFDQELKKQLQALATEAQRVQKQVKPNTPEYRKAEETIAKREADLKFKAQLKKKEVLEQEAQVYYETYNEVVTIVNSLAGRHGIGIVLRYDSQKMDPTDRGTVLRGVNRAVVFQRDLDLTWHVIQKVNPESAKRHFDSLKKHH